MVTIGHQLRTRAEAALIASFWNASSIPMPKTGRYCSMSAVSQEAGRAARMTSKRASADRVISTGIAAHHQRFALVRRTTTNMSGISSENQTSQVSDQSGLLRFDVPNSRRASCHTSWTVGAWCDPSQPPMAGSRGTARARASAKASAPQTGR